MTILFWWVQEQHTVKGMAIYLTVNGQWILIHFVKVSEYMAPSSPLFLSIVSKMKISFSG
jgi:hypothetical protein